MGMWKNFTSTNVCEMPFLQKNRVIETLSFLFIVLYVYTATDKLVHHTKFAFTLGQFPFIGRLHLVLSWLIPVLEILVALLLILPKGRKAGFVGAFGLMSLFTLFAECMLLFSPRLPCSCGGVISQLSWTQHFVFNLMFVLLSLLGIHLVKTTKDVIAINRVSRKPV